MNSLSRRSFLVKSGTLAALYPMIGLVDGCTPDNDDIANLKKGLQISYENGMNLTLYFINLRFKGGKLVPENDNKSYIIAQLPPQSLHEQYFVAQTIGASPNKQVKAKLAGHSFLAFELWPDYPESRKRMIRYNAPDLLDWKDSKIFKLLTTLDNKGNFNCFTTINDVNKAVVAPSHRSVLDLAHYRSILQTLLKQHNYLSILEIPAGLLLAPHVHDDDTRIEVVRNDYCISLKEFKFITDIGLIKRRIIERANLELRYLKISGSSRNTLIPPTLRAIGIVSSEQFQEVNPANPCECLPADTDVNDNFLPSLLDQAELVYLNQLINNEERFDIKVRGPFVLTSTGATLKFSYNNHNLFGRSGNLSLVEYEHHFQDGRDNFIKVSRIGVIAPTSQKALHINIAERVVRNGESFLDYKEFVEILEPVKHFPEPGTNSNSNVFYHMPLIDVEGSSTKVPIDKHYDDKINFTSIRSRFSRTAPIHPINDNCRKEFWVYQQFGEKINENLMQLEFDYFDRNGRQVDKPVKHAIYFMRRDFFCDVEAVKTLMETTIHSFDDGEKMRINFHDQVLAFAPDDPSPGQNGASPNKVNELKTSFVDYYFNVAQNRSDDKNIFDTSDYAIYPQVSRAKVFIDNFQQYSSRPLPSLLEYNEDYLNFYFDRIKNPAKLIAQQRDDFMKGELKDLRGVISPELEQTSKLNGAYRDIQEIFNRATDRAGGLVNPDLKNKYLSYFKGVTLYDDINRELDTSQENKSAAQLMKVSKIFSGASAEIFNGVSLKMILEEISEAGFTPDFNTDMMVADIENIEEYIKTIASNPLITDALEVVITVDRTVKELKKRIQKAQTTIKVYQHQIAVAKNELLSLIPDVNKLKNIAAAAFEEKRLEVFSVGHAAEASFNLVKDEFLRDVYNQRVDFKQTRILFDEQTTNLLGDLTKFANSLPAAEAELKRKISHIDAKTFMLIDAKCAQFVNEHGNISLNEIRNSSEAILIGCSLDFYRSTDGTRSGLHDLEERFIELNAEYQSGAIELKEQLLKIQDDINDKIIVLEKSLDSQIATFLGCIDGIMAHADHASKEKYSQLFEALRTLQKLSTGYYIARYNEFKTNVENHLSTISSNVKRLASDAIEIARAISSEQNKLLNNYLSALTAVNQDMTNIGQTWNNLQGLERSLIDKVDLLILDAKPMLRQYSAHIKAELIKNLNERINSELDEYKLLIQQYEGAILSQGKTMLTTVRENFEKNLEHELDLNRIKAARAEFEKVVSFLSTPKRKELKYQWETRKFKRASLGIISFNPQSSPSTKLKVDVRTNILIDPLKFPAVIDKVETYAENSLTNFSLTFLNVLIIDFSHVSFTTGSGVSTRMNVGIRDVKFDGALSFIQKLEELMSGLGDGFGIAVNPNSVAINYTSPVINISTPGFAFSNITFGVMLQIFFDRKPMEITFMLSRPEAKATIAAGIYGGAFFCSMVAEPKRGLKSIEMALEMGAILGISLGVIRGQVRFMIGLYYKKDDYSVIMEGYFIAEGVLSVWIISVSARLYMYVRSQSSEVTGGCTVTYSAKLGFVKRTFKGSYKKTLAGAQSSRSEIQNNADYELYELMKSHPLDNVEDNFDLLFEEDNFKALNENEWKQVYNTFYKHGKRTRI